MILCVCYGDVLFSYDLADCAWCTLLFLPSLALITRVKVWNIVLLFRELILAPKGCLVLKIKNNNWVCTERAWSGCATCGLKITLHLFSPLVFVGLGYGPSIVHSFSVLIFFYYCLCLEYGSSVWRNNYRLLREPLKQNDYNLSLLNMRELYRHVICVKINPDIQ